MKPQLVRVLGAVFLFAVSLGAAAAPALKFDKLERELHLRPEQKMQFDIAVASTQRALLAVALTALQLKQQAVDELAKPRPDFSTLADAHEQLIEQNRALFQAAGAEWKKFCAVLDDDQLDIAKKYLRDNLQDLFGKLGSIEFGR